MRHLRARLTVLVLLGVLALGVGADAATTLRITYAASTSMTISFNQLGNGSARESAAIDNTTNLYLDALVQLRIHVAAGTVGSDKAVYVYAAGSEDGTKWTDNATGQDAAITLRSPTNLRLIGTIATPDSGGLIYHSSAMSVAVAFGGALPRKWSIIVENKTGLALGSDGTHSYTGLTLTSS